MFRKIFNLASLSLAAVSAAGVFSNSYWFKKIECLETTRNTKIELISNLQNTKSEMIVLVYNKESEHSLRDQIVKLQDECENVKIQKLVLVDQTDIRHLQTFSKMLKNQENNPKDSYPLDLQGKINIFYVNPEYNTMQPFIIHSISDIPKQITQIRSLLKINPTFHELYNSMNTFNRTTVTKNCKDQVCIDQFKSKIKKLIDMELFSGKSGQYKFFLTTSKNQTAKVSSLLGDNSNKDDIYVYYNDLLGEAHLDYKEWLEKEGKNVSSMNRFLMMIRPRVHVISKTNNYTDIIWYMSTLRNLNVPTFCINNTIQKQGSPLEDIQLLKQLQQKYGHKLHLMVLETPIMSELIRHSRSPWRYSIFHLKKQVPYPKKNLSSYITSPLNPPQLYKKIDEFIDSPSKNTELINFPQQKQIQINACKLRQLLQVSQNGKKREEWVLRMCGKKNACEKMSAYEKYGLNWVHRVYKLDSDIQNVALDQGDYLIKGGSIQKLGE